MYTEETSIYIAIVISSLTVCVIILYFAISIVRQQRRNLELTRKNILTELITMERERSRIAIDLHDDLAPILSITKFILDSVTVKDDEKQQIKSASEYIDDIINRLREISNDLMPSSLLRKGLIASIKELTNSFEQSTKVKFSFEADQNIQFKEDANINIYRIIKELFHNTIKHSNATEARLKFTLALKELSIHYYDNGKGFNYEKTLVENYGFGLRNLKSRVEVMEGSMIVESKPNKGTAYLFKIPN